MRLQPLVSIITITYNHNKYISKAMESFLLQKTDFNFEIIIADDASTDNNQDIIRNFQNQHSSIISAVNIGK